MARQRDQHHARHRGRPTRRSRGPHHPAQSPQGRPSTGEQSFGLRPGPNHLGAGGLPPGTGHALPDPVDQTPLAVNGDRALVLGHPHRPHTSPGRPRYADRPLPQAATPPHLRIPRPDLRPQTSETPPEHHRRPPTAIPCRNKHPRHSKAHLSPTGPPGTAQPNLARPRTTHTLRGRAGPQQPIWPSPPRPRAPPPHTDHHPRPQPPPSSPSKRGLRHSLGLVLPTRELDQAHRQGPPGPSNPGQRPPRGHHRPRPLASPPTSPRPARLDPPHRVGPGPDTRDRHQRDRSREHTPTRGGTTQ